VGAEVFSYRLHGLEGGRQLMKLEEKKALKQLLLWIVLLLMVLLPPLIAVLAIGCFGSVKEKKSCLRPRLEGLFWWQNQGLQADFCRIAGLTPPGSYDTLATRVAGFEPQNPELFPVPYCFSSECRSATQRWKSQSWIRPKHYLRRTTIDDP
jgi:hypothetical protein